MMRKIISYFFVFSISFTAFAQENSSTFEKYPVFPECETVPIDQLKDCFKSTLQNFVYSNFELPEIVTSESYKGKLIILFEIDTEGAFKVLYIDAVYSELKDEVNRIFNLLPTITPATYNSNPTYMQFTLPLSIPLQKPVDEQNKVSEENIKNNNSLISNEFDEIKNKGYENEEYTSQLNIPLSHQNYASFDAALNQIGTNNHTAQKPFLYADVNKYQNFSDRNDKLLKNKTSWAGRKLWNEHMVTFKGDDYWFTLDPGVDLQVGKDNDINTYNNTRLVYFQGGLGKKLNFFAAVYESQGRFADYFNRFARSIKPDGGNPGIIPGRGIAELFREDSFDYPVATGYISFTPNKYFNIQLGHGKNFIGDGYRSLLFSDNASTYPYFKLNTTFWKIKYTNTWMSLRDVRPEVTEDGSFKTKYVANHYLSINVSKRLNIGLFESVIWENDNDRGFDFNFINPVIFFRSIEFSTGSRGGNALIGITGKYKFTNRINAYTQIIIDEFSSGDIFGGDKSWKNKIGIQIGAKYYNAFGVKNLYLQAEYNRVRPYTYSHNTGVLNYGHNNQSLAHLWGANFTETIAIARYENGRIFASAKLIFGKRGLDFNNETDSFSYGGNIYAGEENRPSDFGVEIGQGNTTNVFHGELQAGYLINPATNLKIYASLIYRDFTPEVDTANDFKQTTTWINFGIRTDLFNWYYDF